MAEIRIERRRGTGLWPWLIGLVVLALLMWAIAELVNTDRDNKTMAAADSAGAPAANAAAPSAMAPSVPGAAPTPAPGAVAPAAEQPGVNSLGGLLPLGVQDAGQTVGAGGTVLSKPANGGFWLRSDGNVVLWVKGSQSVKPGQQVGEIVGTLRQAQPGEPDAWLGGSDVQAQVEKNRDWQLVTQLYLDASASSPREVRSDSSAAQPHTQPAHGRARTPRRR